MGDDQREAFGRVVFEAFLALSQVCTERDAALTGQHEAFLTVVALSAERDKLAKIVRGVLEMGYWPHDAGMSREEARALLAEHPATDKGAT